jgi:O-methyltransferase domain/Dimerisation domain
MAMGYSVSRALYVTAKLGIADLLSAGPRGSDDLAKACGANPGALFRLLRAMASLGLFTEVSPRKFSLTPMGETLKSKQPAAVRETVLALAGSWGWASFAEFEYAVRTGKPGFEKALGMNAFEYLSKNPEEGALFNDAMIGVHGPEPAAVAKAFDFSGLGTLVDVGGGTGSLIAAILKANPKLKGVLFDMPHVEKPARDRLASMGLVDRCRVEAGSFFDSVPAGDGYVLSHIIHDWDEPRCLKILGNCLRANPKAKVMIVEMVIPPGDAPHPGKMLDLMMLNVPGGMERTGAEYGELLGKAGYRMTRVVPTESAVSVVEGVPR